VTGAEATSLFRLRCVWGDTYSVAFRDGVWSAYRLRGATVLTADTAEELAQRMQSDISAWLATTRTATMP
jgi:hypothetical protein